MANVNIDLDLDDSTICRLVTNYVQHELLLSDPSLEVFMDLVDAAKDSDDVIKAAGTAILNETMLKIITEECDRVLKEKDQKIKEEIDNVI